MKLSIWSSYYVDLSPEDAVTELLKNGIYCSELSDEHGLELLSRDKDFLKTARGFKAFTDGAGFEIPQGHLWLRARICSDETAVTTLFNWIDMYEAIGIKNMVLHCDNLLDTDLSREEKIEKNIEKLKLLAEYIKDKEITICLENLRSRTGDIKGLVDKSATDLLYIIDRVGSKRFGICLDTGHLNLTDRNPREFILTAGEKLSALHIADNHGVNDDHLMPFGSGTIDFTEVVAALREINYKGIFNLEIPGERKLPLPLRAAKIDYIKRAYDYLMK